MTIAFGEGFPAHRFCSLSHPTASIIVAAMSSEPQGQKGKEVDYEMKSDDGGEEEGGAPPGTQSENSYPINDAILSLAWLQHAKPKSPPGLLRSPFQQSAGSTKEAPLPASPASRSGPQAPNQDGIKIGEMAFEHLSRLYLGTSADSGARSTAALLDAHMSNLVWMQSRLINHYENMTRATEFAGIFKGLEDTDEELYNGLVERTNI
ncbi:hypothetical protein DFP72DRAFT_1070654 [Ephemerocybe angulata]|uniref:Uncharacterized protein n=1 Tax=Ephemerocybe angulata TaxID=980116 RepID=A0A8H6HV44_9AGAR|nr:hypothetical protein DFP72DRAFT_1070654 [Tulosesus angulatus]